MAALCSQGDGVVVSVDALLLRRDSGSWLESNSNVDLFPVGDAALYAAGVIGERARAEQFKDLPPSDLGRLISLLEDEMNAASEELRFEEAARLRDEIKDLRRELRTAGGA